LGFIVSVSAFVGAVVTFVQRMFASQLVPFGLGPPPGFATIVIAILFLGGVQLLCIGILGEYVGRIYQNVKGRPLTVIGESVGMDEQMKLRAIDAA
jgi:dolichol-phosphate mannosyltransferase